MGMMWDYGTMMGGTGWMLSVAIFGIAYFAIASLIFSYTFWWTYKKVLKKK